jgi:hypothetical protein
MVVWKDMLQRGEGDLRDESVEVIVIVNGIDVIVSVDTLVENELAGGAEEW